MSLAILDGGTFFHHAAIRAGRYLELFDRVIYMPELTRSRLDGAKLLIVPDRTHPDLLRIHSQTLIDFAQGGGTLVVFGENQAETWLPGVSWTPRPTNFWWWLDKNTQPPHRLVAPEHELFQAVTFADTIWHFHGMLKPPLQAQTLIDVPPDPENHDAGGALLYDDRVTTAGRLIVSTLDPFYHHGSNFMPATTKFLDGFLPWARTMAHSSAA
jgi:hypothetical protein